MSREKLGVAAGRFAAINNAIPRVFTDIIVPDLNENYI
jgi:hypothetical protein